MNKLATGIIAAPSQAAARHDSFVEIMRTVDRLTLEWNDSDRIDMIVRIAARREAWQGAADTRER